MIEVQGGISPARERILEAAERVVGDVGAARMTLDVVAQAAGVSKGGLLYHFPSKESLLGALAKRYVEGMERLIEMRAFMGNLGLLGSTLMFLAIPRAWAFSLEGWLVSHSAARRPHASKPV